MRWKNMKQLKAAAFKRLVGVERDTFDMMISEIKRLSPSSKHKIPGKRRGPKPKLRKEDELLMLLMYYREYRTLFHIGADYGLSEAQCWRIVTGTEKILLQSGQFHLPGKKKLVTGDRKWEVVVIDASEHSIERPKKNSATTTPAKRKSIR
jgi:Helix-turn-helix of DDE superfamily endonuclease